MPASYTEMPAALHHLGIQATDGLLADLGLSSAYNRVLEWRGIRIEENVGQNLEGQILLPLAGPAHDRGCGEKGFALRVVRAQRIGVAHDKRRFRRLALKAQGPLTRPVIGCQIVLLHTGQLALQGGVAVKKERAVGGVIVCRVEATYYFSYIFQLSHLLIFH